MQTLDTGLLLLQRLSTNITDLLLQLLCLAMKSRGTGFELLKLLRSCFDCSFQVFELLDVFSSNLAKI